MGSASDDEPSEEREGPDRSDSDGSPGSPSRSGGVADWMRALREVGPYLDLGWRLAGAVAGPPLLGHFLVDVWFGTTPWGLLAGSALGLATAGLQLKRLQDDLGR